MKLSVLSIVVPGSAQRYFYKFLLVMKITTLLLIIALVHASAASLSQVRLSEKNTSLEKVLNSIEKQTGTSFFYDRKDIRDIHISIHVNNVSLKEALDKCLGDLPLTYDIKDNTVFLSKKVTPLLDKVIPAFKAIDVHGRVIDEKGQPLPGVTIKIKDGSHMVMTDSKGEFNLKQVGDKDIIVISSIGFASRQLNVATELGNIVLIVNSSKLDEIHVIAYGTESSRYATGSTASVSAADIAKQPITNALMALEGQVPGLVVTPSSGAPGASVQIQIRGQNSLQNSLTNAGKPYDQPLFIVDGVPFAPQNNQINKLGSLANNFSNFNTFDTFGGLSPFNSINPADIESITILKDADATSIYGTQGANGVILITTKKGQAGKTRVETSVNSGVNVNTRQVQMLNTQQYIQLRNEAFKNDGLTPNNIPSDPAYAPDLFVFDQHKNTDWFKQFLGKTSNNTDVHASLSGGSLANTFIISTGYTRADYNFPGNFGEKRLTLHSGFHHKSADSKLIVDFTTDYGYDHNNSAGDPSLTKAVLAPPNLPDLINPAGNLVWNYKGVDLNSYQYYSYLKQVSNLQTYNLNNSLRLGYQLFRDLKIGIGMGYSRLTTNESSLNPASSQNPQYASAYASFANSGFQTINIEPQLDYHHFFGNNELSFLVGGTYKKELNDNTQMQGYNYTDDAFLGSISGAGTIFASATNNIYKYVGGFTRLKYVYDQKYIINLTGSRNGSSNFGPGKQFGFFGSVGLGWIFSQETAFNKAPPFISYGKLSGNYGTSGSDGIGSYQYQAFWQPVSSVSPFQGIRPYKPLNLYNPDYSWDTKKALNIALDLGFFHDRILFKATYYENKTSNQLINYILPSQTGFNAVLQNFNATVQNKGLEFTLTANTIAAKEFSWNTTFNISGNRNKLLAFPGLAESPYATIYTIGKPVSEINGYKYKDVNPTTGVFEFYTVNGAVTSSPTYGTTAQGGDLVPIADNQPKFTGGLGNTLTYKNFSLYFFFQFSKQTSVNYLASIYSQNAIPGTLTNEPVAILDHWKNPGDISSIQRLTATTYSDAAAAAYSFLQSSGAYSDASYIRLKTLACSYTLPGTVQKALKLSNCHFYINAQNLLTITGFKLGDPELPGGLFSFPLQRTIVFGLSADF